MNQKPLCQTKTTCPYCGVGCGVIVTQNDQGSVEVKGDPDHPANFGRLCSKGSALAETLDLDGRLLVPEVNGKDAHWDEALELIASKFSETIANHGPDSVAFYVSGQLLTEDYYVANKLMKGFIGSANIDTNSRLCMASSVAGHRRAFGSDTVPGVYKDLECADIVVLVGSNLAWCHPVIYQRVMAAKEQRPDMKIIVIDPRRTVTAQMADLHLPISTDGDVALFSILLNYLVEKNLVDTNYIQSHTQGFSQAILAASKLDSKELGKKTGLNADMLNRFFEYWVSSEKVVTVYSQGVNQSASGTDKVNAIINCHLATGRIGKPGMGPFSITGQPNAMGGREVGGLSNILAAHMEIEDPVHRDRVQRFWQSPTIAHKAGLKAVDMFKAVAEGQIKAIWIMATNPVVSMPDAGMVEKALKVCPFVVVSDMMMQTDTVRHAHVKLPSLGWGEKDGTVTNSERRISRQRKFLTTPGQAKADWWQLAEVGRRMGFQSAFQFQTAAAIFREYAQQTAFENNGDRDLDIGVYADINDAEYETLRPLQWPAAKIRYDKGKDHRFFAQGRFFTADRKARFIAVTPPETLDQHSQNLLILNTGRIRDHWHSMTRTGKSPRLSSHLAEPFAEINPADAIRFQIRNADLLHVKNEHDEITVRVLVTDRVVQGQIFVPIHFTQQFASNPRVGKLAASNVDPYSGQPALKNNLVDIKKMSVSHFGFIVSRQMPLMDECAYWARVKTDAGWRAEFALGDKIENFEALTNKILQRPHGSSLLVFRDKKSGLTRAAAFDGVNLIGVLYLAAEPVKVSRNWACNLLKEKYTDLASRWRVIAGRSADNTLDKGAIICSCMGVCATEITRVVTGGCRSIRDVGEATGAGTNCGSCKAEIKVIIDENQVIAAE